MGRPLRYSLALLFAAVAWTAAFHAIAPSVAPSEVGAADGYWGQRGSRGGSSIEGRVALTVELAQVLARGDVPRLEVHVSLPAGTVRTPVARNGRFLIEGLPRRPFDLEVRLGGELLARVSGVLPSDRPAFEGDGIALEGPLHVIELVVTGSDGAPVDGGWLAWRPAGAESYGSAVPIAHGAATVVSLEPIVDVQVLAPGYTAGERCNVFSGERILVQPGPRLVTALEGVPESVVLKLEATYVRAVAGAPAPPRVEGEAAQRAYETVGGWLDGGRTELRFT